MIHDLALHSYSLGVSAYQPPPSYQMPTRLLISRIQEVVADYYGIPMAHMLSTNRSRHYAYPRQVAMYLARSLTMHSLPAIGRRFGGRDHTTVIWAIKAVRQRMRDFGEVAQDVAVLRERLGG